jgi:hypothetical protein
VGRAGLAPRRNCIGIMIPSDSFLEKDADAPDSIDNAFGVARHSEVNVPAI